MRNKKVMMKLIKDFALNNDNIRLMVMNGSRVNPNAPEDKMQDYDVACFLNNISEKPFLNDRNWINYFGEIAMVQQNFFEDDSYIFLIQFKDGVRIDICFVDLANYLESLEEDSLSKVIIDKDNLVVNNIEATEDSYFVKKPNAQKIFKTFNNLWWIQLNIAKGLWRNEIPYAKFMYDEVMMKQIRDITSWYISSNNSWEINVGKAGKWFYRFLDKDLYNEFLSLYTDSKIDNIWEGLFKSQEYIRKIGMYLESKISYFSYPYQDDENVSELVLKIKNDNI